MKTRALYALAVARPPVEWLPSKVILIAAVIALLFASLPVSGVLAAPAGDGAAAQPDMAREWSAKLRHLRAEGFFYNTVRLYPGEFEDLDDLARAQFYLNKYGFAYLQASTLVANHPGFDEKGRVSNEIQAADTLHKLGEYLKAMRGWKVKMAEINDEALWK